MARRISERDLEKQRQRRVLIFSIFMIGLLVFSTFAYFLSSPGSAGTTQLEYGDYEFWYDPRPEWGTDAAVLVTEINGQEIEFQGLPVEVGYLNVSSEAVTMLKAANQIALSTPTDLAIDDASTVDYVRLQLGLAIPKAFNAMSTDDERYSLPVFTCDEATPQLPVVLFNATNETASVTLDGSCVIVNGEGRRLMQLKDRLIYEYYGILRDGEVVDD